MHPTITRTQNSKSRSVPPGKVAEFPVDRPNELALRGGDITLKLTHHFKGAGSKSETVEFTYPVPIQVSLGRKILPRSEGERRQPQTPPLSEADDLAWRLRQKASYIILPEYAEIDDLGAARILRMYEPERRLSVDPVRRLVYFGTLDGGKWRDLKLPLRQTSNGSHYIEARWHVGVRSYLIVDNSAVAFEAKTSKMSAPPPRELLANGLAKPF